MLNVEEILKLTENIPCGYQRPFSELFKKSSETFVLKYKKLGSISNIKDEHINEGIENVKTAFCNAPGCQESFDEINSLQSHYYSKHQFICSECKKSLPTEHFLDLHILEQHDSFFAARVARGDCIYSCLLAECDKRFYDSLERMQHCITDHKFPPNFRFQETLEYSVQPSKWESRDRECKSNPKACENSNTCEGIKLKNISFGHTKNKAFSFKHKSQNTTDKEQTLESMDTLTEALNDIVQE